MATMASPIGANSKNARNRASAPRSRSSLQPQRLPGRPPSPCGRRRGRGRPTGRPSSSKNVDLDLDRHLPAVARDQHRLVGRPVAPVFEAGPELAYGLASELGRDQLDRESSDQLGCRIARQLLARPVDGEKPPLEVEEADHFARALEEQPIGVPCCLEPGAHRIPQPFRRPLTTIDPEGPMP